MASPTVLQGRRTSSIRADALTNNSFFNVRLPNKSLAGNGIAVFFEYEDGALTHTGFQVTDDKGNSYTGVDGGADTVNGQSCCAFYALGIAADTLWIQVKNISGGFLRYVQATVVEMNDVTAIDVSNKANGTSAGATGGSLAVTQTDDFILLYTARVGGSMSTTSYTPTAHANITWRKVTDDLLDGTSLQCGSYGSTTAITPQIDMGTSGDWVGVSLAFKTASVGSPRPTSGIYIAFIHDFNFLNPGPSPLKMEVPTLGNLVVMMTSGGPGAHGQVTAISDTQGNTWTIKTPVVNDASSQICYAASANPADTLVITATLNDAASDSTYKMYDVINAGTTPAPVYVSGTGDELADIDLTTLTITPTAANGLVLGQESHANGTDIDMTGGIFDALQWGGQPTDGPTNGDENNGWAHIYNTNTSPITFVWPRTPASANAGNWEATAIWFPAGAGVVTPTPPPPSANVPRKAMKIWSR